MHCINHPSTPSIGICKACYKGICRDCAADLRHGLACKDRCEPQVEFLNQMVSNHKLVLGKANKQLKASGIFMVMIGATFLFLWGFAPVKSGSTPFHAFLLSMGVIFILFGAFSLRRKARFPEAKAESPASP